MSKNILNRLSIAYETIKHDGETYYVTSGTGERGFGSKFGGSAAFAYDRDDVEAYDGEDNYTSFCEATQTVHDRDLAIKCAKKHQLRLAVAGACNGVLTDEEFARAAEGLDVDGIPKIELSSYDLGDVTEADYDRWVDYVCDHIDEACGFEVEVDRRKFGETGSDKVTNATGEQVATIVEAVSAMWDAAEWGLSDETKLGFVAAASAKALREQGWDGNGEAYDLGMYHGDREAAEKLLGRDLTPDECKAFEGMVREALRVTAPLCGCTRDAEGNEQIVSGESVADVASKLPADGSWGRVKIVDEQGSIRGWASSPTDWRCA